MIISGEQAVAQCDGCGAEAEAYEARNPKTGALSAAFLPAGWKFNRVPDGVGGVEDVHRCAACAEAAVDPFGDRREAFEARLDGDRGGLLDAMERVA